MGLWYVRMSNKVRVKDSSWKCGSRSGVCVEVCVYWCSANVFSLVLLWLLFRCSLSSRGCDTCDGVYGDNYTNKT